LLSFGHSAGISGFSGMSGKDCSSCHSGSAAPATVTIQGPTSLSPGATGSYSVLVSGGAGVEAGLDVAVTTGATLGVVDSKNTKLLNGELTQTDALAYANGSASFPLSITAPSSPGTVTVYVAGLADDGDGTKNGDMTGTTTIQINVTSPSGNGGDEVPIIVEPAAAVPSLVTGTTALLSALAIEGGPGGDLTYTWSAPSGGGITFSPNGTTSSNDTTATFTAAGTYDLTVTVTDATSGDTTTSTCTVVVQSIAAAVAVSPTTATVQTASNQVFTATVNDQFGAPLSPQPQIDWSVSGGGTLDSGGTFTAGASPGGPFAVQATADFLEGAANVTVSSEAPPTTVLQALAASSPVTGTTTSLQVLGADHAGEQGLTYTWSVLSGGNVRFSPNASNAAKNTTATFSAVGNYSLQVALTDSEGDTTVSQVSVSVAATPSRITVSPGNTTVAPGGNAIFTASVTDQFGNPISAATLVSWTVSGGGAISDTGRFVADSAVGGPFTVTALAGGLTGTATVAVNTVAGAPSGPGATNSASSCSAAGGRSGSAWLALAFVAFVLGRGALRRAFAQASR
jgi:hypothetical protein